MITKFEKFNEGINHLLVGPTKEEIWSYYINGELKGLLKSVPTSPEDFFNQMKDNCVQMGSNINGEFYGKNGFILFCVNPNGYLYVIDKYIWSIFYNVYDMDYNGVQSLIKNILVDDIKWSGLKPYSMY